MIRTRTKAWKVELVYREHGLVEQCHGHRNCPIAQACCQLLQSLLVQSHYTLQRCSLRRSFHWHRSHNPVLQWSSVSGIGARI